MIQIQTGKPIPPDSFALFALGFRPFFLLAGLGATLLMLYWVVAYTQGGALTTHYPLVSWHSHEMVYGYTTAVVAGFLLTAVRNWTGMPTLTGTALAALALIWLAARLFAFIAVPTLWLALVDVAFLALLAWALALPILKARQWNNLFAPVLVLLLALMNGVFHAGVAGSLEAGVEWGLRGGFGVIIVLITVMAGRVVGFFIERGLGGGAKIRTWPWAEWLAIGGSALYMALQFTLDARLLAVVAILAALGHAMRLLGWYQPRMWSVPLLWVLYLAYAWLTLGFVLMALAQWGLLHEGLAIHAFTAGAIGVMTLGMMARVALGHTGRNMQSHRLTDAAFVLVNLAALLRVFGPMLDPGHYGLWVMAAGVSWALAFSLFVMVYAPMLLKARVDGQPG